MLICHLPCDQYVSVARKITRRCRCSTILRVTIQEQVAILPDHVHETIKLPFFLYQGFWPFFSRLNNLLTQHQHYLYSLYKKIFFGWNKTFIAIMYNFLFSKIHEHIIYSYTDAVFPFFCTFCLFLIYGYI